MQTDKPKPPSAANEAKRRLIAKRYPPRRPPKKLVAIANKMLAPALALCVVVGVAAAGSGDADYALIAPGEKPICAKSHADCLAARDAIAAGRWPIVPRDTPVICRPTPACFPEASNHIPGFK